MSEKTIILIVAFLAFYYFILRRVTKKKNTEGDKGGGADIAQVPSDEEDKVKPKKLDFMTTKKVNFFDLGISPEPTSEESIKKIMDGFSKSTPRAQIIPGLEKNGAPLLGKSVHEKDPDNEELVGATSAPVNQNEKIINPTIYESDGNVQSDQDLLGGGFEVDVFMGANQDEKNLQKLRQDNLNTKAALTEISNGKEMGGRGTAPAFKLEDITQLDGDSSISEYPNFSNELSHSEEIIEPIEIDQDGGISSLFGRDIADRAPITGALISDAKITAASEALLSLKSKPLVFKGINMGVFKDFADKEETPLESLGLTQTALTAKPLNKNWLKAGLASIDASKPEK